MAPWCRPFQQLLFGGWWAIAGCGSDTSTQRDGAGASPAGIDALGLPYEPCSAEAGVGEFSIELGPDFTSAQGKVFDGVTPSLVPEQLASEGECRLLKLPTLLCDPGCPVATQTCGVDNQCVNVPSAHPVGTVTLRGLVVPVVMTANAGTGSYRPEPARLPHPGFEPGADLRLQASGGDYAAFELRGWGVSPLELGADPIRVAQGEATTVEWTVPDEVGPARMQLALDINNHGSSNASIECDVADTGAAEIPGALIDALIAEGSSGFPTVTLTRRTASSIDIALGCVQMLVTSSISTDVALAGLVSCDTASPCPEGQRCRALERFCE